MQITDQPSTGSTPPAASQWRRPWVLAAALTTAATVGIGAVAIASQDDPVGQPGAVAMALSIAPGGAMSSCLPFDVAVLADMPVAFAATATAVDAESVRLDVDRWYVGGSADQVTVMVPAGVTSIALDGVSFVAGRRYPVTATNETVNGCGFSGPATAELEAAYSEAFPG